jgi:hypothetical protein
MQVLAFTSVRSYVLVDLEVYIQADPVHFLAFTSVRSYADLEVYIRQILCRSWLLHESDPMQI